MENDQNNRDINQINNCSSSDEALIEKLYHEKRAFYIDFLFVQNGLINYQIGVLQYHNKPLTKSVHQEVAGTSSIISSFMIAAASTRRCKLC